MTENQVLRLLQRIIAQKGLIESIRGQMEELEAIGPCAVDTTKSRVSGGEVEDISRTLARVEKKRARLIRRYVKRIDELMDAETKAESLVELIESAEIRSILMDRYMLGKGWDTIAKEHNYERSTIFRKRREGIREMAMKSKKSYRRKTQRNTTSKHATMVVSKN